MAVYTLCPDAIHSGPMPLAGSWGKAETLFIYRSRALSMALDLTFTYSIYIYIYIYIHVSTLAHPEAWRSAHSRGAHSRGSPENL